MYSNLINYFNFFAVFIFLYLKRTLIDSNSVLLQSEKKLSCHYISLRKCFLEIRSFIQQAKSSITHNVSLMHWLFTSETGSSWHKVKWNTQMPLLKMPVKHLSQPKLCVRALAKGNKYNRDK